ncbi:MAG: mechanosensitive ion channel family protein [Actinomycetota bacterium]|nr:mechanosensitive ion channel family protein [Actinomycetota bacterium]
MPALIAQADAVPARLPPGCRSDDWICEAVEALGLGMFATRSLELVLSVALIVVLAALASRFGVRLARRSVYSLGTRSPLRDTVGPRAEARAKTLAGVTASVVRVTVWTLAILLMLDEVGFNLGPLLAGASVVGVALAFGAQSLVRDVLSGFFILVEDQYGVGDTISVLDVTGTVEEVNLRVTRVRAGDGTVWFVPNGEIRKVGNSAKEWAKAIVDIRVPEGVELSTATSSIAAEVEALAADPRWTETLLEAPEVLGVEDIAGECVLVRVSAKTAPGDRARVARELRSRIGNRLQRDAAAPPRETGSASAGGQ